MSELGSTLGTQINTPLARLFRTIVTAGWANLSDGNVEAPTGAFSLVHIEPTELDELMLAVFDGADLPVRLYPGSYFVHEDSDGNTTVTEYITLNRALEAYNSLVREFAWWDATCSECDMEGPHTNATLDGKPALKCDNGHIFDPTPEATSLPLQPDIKVRRS
jgi:hypothetical protein